MRTIYDSQDLQRIVEMAAVKNNCDLDVAVAIASVESSWDTYAVRYEPAWKYLYQVEKFAKSDLITAETEEQLQKMSWGLMQVMGSVCRELGFMHALPMVCEPEIGADLGTKKYAQLFRKYQNEDDAIAAYNAGSPRKVPSGLYVNQGYVNKVKKIVEELRQVTKAIKS